MKILITPELAILQEQDNWFIPNRLAGKVYYVTKTCTDWWNIQQRRGGSEWNIPFHFATPHNPLRRTKHGVRRDTLGRVITRTIRANKLRAKKHKQ